MTFSPSTAATAVVLVLLTVGHANAGSHNDILRMFRALATNNTNATTAPNMTMAPNMTDAPTTTPAPTPNMTMSPNMTMAPNMTYEPNMTAMPNKTDAPINTCEGAIIKLVGQCPGFAAIGAIFGNSTNEALGSFCPCVGAQAQSDYLITFFELEMNCGSEFMYGVYFMSNVMCAQDSNQKYCGTQFAPIMSGLQQIGEAMDKANSTNLEPAVRTQLQQNLTTVCTRCFDVIVLGVFDLIGQQSASIGSITCDAKCMNETKTEAKEMLDTIQILNICVRNDNSDQVAAGDPFCLPWLADKLLPLGANCSKQNTSQSCTRSDECVWHKSKCYAVKDRIFEVSEEPILPPHKVVGDLCMNSCFLRAQGSVADAANLVHNAYVDRGVNVGLSDASFTKVSDSLDVISTFGCLANANGTCVQQYENWNVTEINAACVNETATFSTANPTCSAACGVAMNKMITGLGCCWNTMWDLQTVIDPNFEYYPNFNAVADACGAIPAPGCNPWGSAPQPVSTQVSGNCAWLTSSPDNTNVVLKSTAKALGISSKAMLNFTVKAGDGSSCNSTRRNRATATSGLQANFNVVARDNSTAQRIASNANNLTTSITIPAAQVAVAKAETQQRFTTPAPPTVAPTVTPTATPRPTVTLPPTTLPPTSSPTPTVTAAPTSPPITSSAVMNGCGAMTTVLVLLAACLFLIL